LHIKEDAKAKINVQAFFTRKKVNGSKKDCFKYPLPPLLQ
jgi:hypothetical protein